MMANHQYTSSGSGSASGNYNSKRTLTNGSCRGSNRRSAKWRAYSKYAVRRKSFYDAPESLRQQSSDHARWGFYYKGYGSKIVCFHCGLELDTRDEQFDSYVTHLEMAPDCLFIQQPGDDSETEDVSIENGMEVETNLPSRSGEQDRLLITGESDHQESTVTPDIGTRTIPVVEDPLERLRCKVCLTEQISITFKPCGHFAVCGACARRLSICPVCRTRIREKINTYLT